ncbi:MAG: hydantoinase B/oxoprolinase family protein, partial [Rhodospirillaceae bacterium]|nr:hydantoinase B/oxoprolinase family protein [Rhodospirillaceae bacterium]
NNEREDLPNCAVVTLVAGELISSQSCGGGGYGVPTERDPDTVARDVVEDYVSAERARSVYGVVLDGVGNVDAAATTKLRAEMTA